MFTKFIYYKIAAFSLVIIIILILPKILITIDEYNILLKLYNYKNIIQVESFDQVHNSFYFGYLLLMITIMLVFGIIFFPDIVLYWNTKEIVFFSFIISLLFLGVLLVYGPINDEFYSDEVTSAIVRINNYFKMQILLWFDGRGFGTPLPTIQSPDTHPIFMLKPFISLRIIYSIFWIIHLTAGTYYFIKLSQMLGMNNSLSLINGVLFVFSMETVMSTIFYNYSSVFICWSLFPIITYYSFKLFLCKNISTIKIIIILSFIISFTVYNGLPSIYAHYYAILSICVLFILLNKLRLSELFSFYDLFRKKGFKRKPL